ncbi:MAG: hypothetical protein MUC50_11180 [Myxococcota bacterium]|jgi:hypothetical protein|nr:hypothetical protein [Myxococcota bacterium]
MGERKRELLLIGAVVLVGVLALLPPLGPQLFPQQEDSDATFDGLETIAESDSDSSTEIDTMDMRADAPSEGVFHDYFPLEIGATWHYRVDGPHSLVPSGLWSMRVVSLPTDDAPGKVAAGFNGVLVEQEIEKSGNVLRFSFLPLLEPLEHLGNQAISISGETLPEPPRFEKGAAWTMTLERNLPYQYRDRKGRPVERKAGASQISYARIEEYEDVTVPAGRFHAFRIEWSSRLTMSVEKRQVLDSLTAKPFREEIVWIAKGVGIVRRYVTYPGYKGAKVSFDLLRYDAPGR